MALYEIQNLSFRYAGLENQKTAALCDVCLTIPAGSFTVLLGPSGGGKTTLLRLLKPELAPHGTRIGEILFDGSPIDTLSVAESACRIGFVQQSPEAQLVTDTVWHELAFGLESLGLENAVIRRRTAEMASFFGMQSWFRSKVSELSGGQKQLLNIAAAMVMQPEVLILDEPTAQLDPIAAEELLSMLEKLNRELGTTIILSEHRLEQLLPIADLAAVLEGGRLLYADSPRRLGTALAKQHSPRLAAWPAAMQLWAATELCGTAPISIREGRQWLREYTASKAVAPLPPEQLPVGAEEITLSASDVWFRYGRDDADVVSGLELKLKKGRITALLGGNGTGKTTTLKLLAGLLKPLRGTVKTTGTVGLLPQDPQTLFQRNTVLEDLQSVFEGRHLPEVERRVCAKQLQEILALTRLEGLADRHPYDLSGGEQQRAALAKLMLCQPELLLLDEPTRGMDAEFKACFAEILHDLQAQGRTILLVSHDIEFCASNADECMLFFDGSIAAQGTTRAFFSGNRFYTTAAGRIARGILPGAVTIEDILACLQVSTDRGNNASGGSAEDQEDRKEGALGSEQGNGKCADGEPLGNLSGERAPEKAEMVGEEGRNDVGKSAKADRNGSLESGPGYGKLPAILITLLLMPLTLWVGLHFFEGRKYYFISLLLLLEAMAPFYVRFEQRKPSSRELVVLAVLCALAVAGRAIFFMLPQFKPVMALTILAGAALGAESGFLVGSLSMLVSNMLFAQGPWTPWQMFAMGLTGFLAGLLFYGRRVPRRRLPLCLYGIFAAIVIYGGIMNPASALMWSEDLQPGILLTYYISGFPMDCIQALATALFLWLLAGPLLEKLQRVGKKFGLPICGPSRSVKQKCTGL